MDSDTHLQQYNMKLEEFLTEYHERNTELLAMTGQQGTELQQQHVQHMHQMDCQRTEMMRLVPAMVERVLERNPGASEAIADATIANKS